MGASAATFSNVGGRFGGGVFSIEVSTLENHPNTALIGLQRNDFDPDRDVPLG
jgi:hypothetical protein